MDKLLKDAIADAKAVRETALANAKIALEEAFTPHLKSMLSKKLQAEMDHEDEEKEADEAYHGEEMEDEDKEMDEEMDTSGIGSSDNKEPAPDAGDTSGIGQGPESEGDDEEGGEEDENLMKAPDQPVGEGYGMDDDKDMDEEMEDEDMEDEGHHEEGYHGEEDKDMDEEMEDEDEDVKEALRQLEAEMNDEEMEDEEMKKEEMEDEDEDMKEEMEDEDKDMDEDIDLDEIIKALTEEEGMEDEEEDEKNEEMKDEDEDMKEELEEYKQTVQYLRDKLSEVNLLNAKLLYTNKLFRSRNVSEAQKMKVIEQFDRATNVREVKLVFTTFAESMKRKPVNESAKRVSQASKPTNSTKSKKKPIIGENTDFKSRMKKLANII
tara:strand:+ start:140 stop:1276 length:1137 start_codon:yes stop_codon:yes gene_type:complete